MDPKGSSLTEPRPNPAQDDVRHAPPAVNVLHLILEGFALAACGLYPTETSISVARQIWLRQARARGVSKPTPTRMPPSEKPESTD